MVRSLVLVVAVAAGCGGRGPAVRPPTQGPAPPSAACTTPEHRQLDFWLGDWDLEIRARRKPGVDAWDTAHATQHVTAELGGCAIHEAFSADGPGTPWSGASYSSWQPARGAWRQTWVDDQGSYLAFTGGLEDGVMTLYGEPFDAGGAHVQMRMVFLAVTATSLRWEWQRSADGGPWTPAMIIEYRRRDRVVRPSP